MKPSENDPRCQTYHAPVLLRIDEFQVDGVSPASSGRGARRRGSVKRLLTFSIASLWSDLH